MTAPDPRPALAAMLAEKLAPAAAALAAAYAEDMSAAPPPSCPDAPPSSCPDLFRASNFAAAMAPDGDARNKSGHDGTSGREKLCGRPGATVRAGG